MEHEHIHGFVVNAEGILVPAEPPAETPAPEAAPERPIVEGWHYSRCGDRYYEAHDTELVKKALEFLYIAAAAKSGFFDREAKVRREAMVDTLAIELVGGVPESYSEYT